MIEKLTADQLGSYTCEAGNGYRAHCRRESVEIRLEGKQQSTEEKDHYKYLSKTGRLKKQKIEKKQLYQQSITSCQNEIFIISCMFLGCC